MIISHFPPMTSYDNSWLHSIQIQNFIIYRSYIHIYVSRCFDHVLFCGIAHNRELANLTGAASQGISMSAIFLLHVPQCGGTKQRSSSDLCNCEPIRSGSDPQLTLQTASRALWDPKHFEAAERRSTHCKMRNYKASAHNKTQSKQQRN